MSSMDNSKWLTVAEYAKKHNRSINLVYQDIYCRRIPEENVIREKVERKIIKIKDK